MVEELNKPSVVLKTQTDVSDTGSPDNRGAQLSRALTA